MYKNDSMYILVSTFGRIIRVSTRISCIHVQCLHEIMTSTTACLKVSFVLFYLILRPLSWRLISDLKRSSTSMIGFEVLILVIVFILQKYFSFSTN